MYTKKQSEMLINSMPIIASALGDKLGVRITVSGTGAYTTGEQINIPEFQLSSKEEKDAVLGYLAHEAAHIRFNSLDGINQSVFSTILRKSLWNIFEDIRIENLMATKFVGTIQWMNATAKQVFLKNLKLTSEQEEPASILFDLLLFYGRSVFRTPAQDFLDFKFQAAKSSSIKVFGPKLTNDILTLVGTELPQLNSSSDALILATKVEELLEDQVSDDNDSQGDSNSDDNDSQGDSDSDDNDSQGDSDSDDNDSQGDSDSDDNDSQGDSDSDDKKDAIKSVLVSSTTYDDMDSFAQTMQLLSRANSATGSTVEMPKQNKLNVNDFFTSMAKDLIKTVNANSNQLSAKLQSFVEAQMRSRCKTKKSGSRLNSNVLHRLSIGDSRVFKDKADSLQIDTRVEIVIDNSGSMEALMPIARQATLSLALALSKINGVKQGATAFPVDFDLSRMYEKDNIINLLDDNEPVHNLSNRLVQLKGNGHSTPSASAMLYTLKKLSNSQAKKQVIFFITDGLCNADSSTAFKNYISLAEKNNITVIGIGIGSLARNEEAKHEFNCQFQKAVFITNIKNLKTELFKLAKDIFL